MMSSLAEDFKSNQEVNLPLHHIYHFWAGYVHLFLFMHFVIFCAQSIKTALWSPKIICVIDRCEYNVRRSKLCFLGDYLVIPRGPLGFSFLSSLIVVIFIIVPYIWRYINYFGDILVLLMLWYIVKYKPAAAAIGIAIATITFALTNEI